MDAGLIKCDVLLFKVNFLQRKLNGNLRDMVGDYKYVCNVLEVPTSAKNSKDKSKEKGLQIERIVLNDKNTIFVDIEAVQRTMVKLYGITQDGIFSSNACYL